MRRDRCLRPSGRHDLFAGVAAAVAKQLAQREQVAAAQAETAAAGLRQAQRRELLFGFVDAQRCEQPALCVSVEAFATAPSIPAPSVVTPAVQ